MACWFGLKVPCATSCTGDRGAAALRDRHGGLPGRSTTGRPVPGLAIPVRPMAPVRRALSHDRRRGKERCGRRSGDLRGRAAPKMRFVPVKSLEQQAADGARACARPSRGAAHRHGLNRIRGLAQRIGIVPPLKAATVRVAGPRSAWRTRSAGPTPDWRLAQRAAPDERNASSNDGNHPGSRWRSRHSS